MDVAARQKDRKFFILVGTRVSRPILEVELPLIASGAAMDVAISTLLSPIILFFALGMAAALLRSQMSVPEAVAKGMAI